MSGCQCVRENDNRPAETVRCAWCAKEQVYTWRIWAFLVEREAYRPPT